MERQFKVKSGALLRPAGDNAAGKRRLPAGGLQLSPAEKGLSIGQGDPAAILQGVIWSEIIGPPRCRRRGLR